MVVDWFTALDFLAIGVAEGIFNHIRHDERGRDGGGGFYIGLEGFP